jgi:hypothetical protein
MATGEDALRVLKSIDAKLEVIAGLLASGGAPRKADTPAARIASDEELDGEYGDPDIKAKSPRDWTGPSMTGKRFSECPAEYLDLVAERLDYFAEQNANDVDPEMKKKARWNRIDASRARGWAARIRKGYKPPPRPGMGEDASPFTSNPDDSDIPF